MKKIMTILVIAVVGLVGLRFCFRKVPIDRVGVKILQLSGGVVQADFHPGFVFCIPGVHELELMDSTLQFFTMAPSGDTKQSLNLRGSDQFVTQVDVTVVYRIKPEEAHKALVRHGRGYSFKTNLRSFAGTNIWNELAKLDTQDFYNSEKRLAGARRALDTMNDGLKGHSLEVLDVLVRNVKYDPNFEQKLLAKQLLDQRQQLELSSASLEKEKEITEVIKKSTDAQVLAIKEELKAEVNKLTATTDAKIAKIEADSDYYAQKATADASNYERQKIAEGELLRTQAKAKGEKAVTESYAGPGGQMYLARQLVENIEFGAIEINTNQVNPFDVQQMLKMLGIEVKEPVTAKN